MASYYKHTQKQSVNVPYSFRCEQCHQDSGLLEAVITGSANLNTHSKVLLDREQAKLSRLSHAVLVREAQSVHREATQKNRRMPPLFMTSVPTATSPSPGPLPR